MRFYTITRLVATIQSPTLDYKRNKGISRLAVSPWQVLVSWQVFLFLGRNRASGFMFHLHFSPLKRRMAVVKSLWDCVMQRWKHSKAFLSSATPFSLFPNGNKRLNMLLHRRLKMPWWESWSHVVGPGLKAFHNVVERSITLCRDRDALLVCCLHLHALRVGLVVD